MAKKNQLIEQNQWPWQRPWQQGQPHELQRECRLDAFWVAVVAIVCFLLGAMVTWFMMSAKLYFVNIETSPFRKGGLRGDWQ
jgi:hypothetical protein